MPYLALRPVRWLSWLTVGGWRLYRDRLGGWYLVHAPTRRVRPLRRYRPPPGRGEGP